MNDGAEPAGTADIAADPFAHLNRDARICGARSHAMWLLPVVLTTGYGMDAIPPAYAALPRREKPVSLHDIARALERALNGWLLATSHRRRGTAAPGW